MATKNVAEVVIAGKIVKITGYESMEYLHQVASYINEKIGQLEQVEGYRRQSSGEKQLMLYMNLADDYFKSKHLAEQLSARQEAQEKEMYSLKHDLIECQLAKEALEKTSLENAQDLQGTIDGLKEQVRILTEQLEAEKRNRDQGETERKSRYTRNSSGRSYTGGNG